MNHYISDLIKQNTRNSLLECINCIQDKEFLKSFSLLPQHEKEETLIILFNKFAYTYITQYEKYFTFLNSIENISEKTSKILFDFWLKHTNPSKYEKTIDLLLDLDIQINPQWTSNMNIYDKTNLSFQYDNLEPASAFFKIYAKNPNSSYHDYHNMAELIMSCSNYYKSNLNALSLTTNKCYMVWGSNNNNPNLTQPPLIEKIKYFALEEEVINYLITLEHKKGYHQIIAPGFNYNQDMYYRKKLYSTIQLALKDNKTSQYVHFLMTHLESNLKEQTLKKYSTLKKDDKIYLYIEKDRLDKNIVDRDKALIKKDKKNKI